MKPKLARIRGWLTRDEMEILEEAGKRKLKYPKSPAKKFSCSECNYTWLYPSVRCPVCSSQRTQQVK
ncbi:MAG TPA: hypothetical protein VJI12_01805 [archaeon]|nr:hypothetical protein [archaeon]